MPNNERIGGVERHRAIPYLETTLTVDNDQNDLAHACNRPGERRHSRPIPHRRWTCAGCGVAVQPVGFAGEVDLDDVGPK